MAVSLGKWAVIDIETTGVHPQRDQVIDLGFLQFDGTKLIRTYSSLVRHEGKVSQFVQKLTGITSKMLRKAPAWGKTEVALGELENHQLLAHNASFESSFLERYFESSEGERLVEFQDSLFFLGLLFPERPSLNLESFITDFNINDEESHRGLLDARDLLKVMLVVCGLCLKKREYKTRKHLLVSLEAKYKLHEMWCFNLLNLSEEELTALAQSVEFDLWKHLEGLGGSGEQEKGGPSLEMSCDLEFSGKNVKAIWQNKKLPKVFPGHRYRKAQEELSLRVGQSFKNNTHAMIQAPTGTGKTLGYLLPASLFSLGEEQRVLVATGTKTLQHQIMNKDLPLLRKILGVDEKELKVRSLVGSQNHFCELLHRRDLQEDLLMETRPFSQRYALATMDMVFGLNDLLGQEIKRGDVAYVLKKMNRDLEVMEKKIAVDFRACIGRKCPYKGSCTYFQGLLEARDAHIIVGNHALMFHWPKGLPRPGHVVVDEAHKLEKETSAAFSLELQERDLLVFVQSLEQQQGLSALFYLLNHQRGTTQETTELINNIRTEVKSHTVALRDHMGPFRDVCEQYFKRRAYYTSLYWNEAPMLEKNHLKDELSQGIFNHLESFHFIFKALDDLISPYAQLYSDKDFHEENALMAFSKFESFYATLEEYRQCLEQVLEDKTEYASSFSYHEEYGFSLQSIPIDVGRIVYEELLQGPESVVFTSATLGNSSGDFATQGVEWPLGHTYLDSKRRYRGGLFLPPVYDYKNNAKVFLCDDVPPMNDPHFLPTVLEHVINLIKKLAGKSLLLFSAKIRFELAREILLEKISNQFPLFVQGMGNNIVEEYRKSPQGILLGMEAFGEGIDLPGESLQFVFIDKIPDLRQDFVIKQRRDFFEQSFGNEFTDYFLAHRARSLAQKLGRLLRREQDIGGAIIVDARIKRWKGRTMSQFSRLMEPYEINRSPLAKACDEVYQFLSPK